MKHIKVRVYTDPITRQEPEGTAELLSYKRPTPDGLCWCFVEFPNGDRVGRWVAFEDIDKALKEMLG